MGRTRKPIPCTHMVQGTDVVRWNFSYILKQGNEGDRKVDAVLPIRRFFIFQKTITLSETWRALMGNCPNMILECNRR